MKNPNSHAGTIGWGLVALGVGVWDTLADETLTHACHRWLEKPHTRAFILAVGAITVVHLLDRNHDILPKEIDPFLKIGEIATKAHHEYLHNRFNNVD